MDGNIFKFSQLDKMGTGEHFVNVELSFELIPLISLFSQSKLTWSGRTSSQIFQQIWQRREMALHILNVYKFSGEFN